MKLLFIADGRSPTALSWISYFIELGEEVHLLSSFPCEPMAGLASFEVVPVALSQSQGEGKPAGGESLLRRIVPVGMRTRIRQWLGPFTLPKAATQLCEAMDRVDPDLVHAMRIPYEGMLGAQAYELRNSSQRAGKRVPLVISVWGNDFTLHAKSTKWMADFTHRTLQQADGLHTDCQRDQRLAAEWGFNPQKAAVVLPGGGGIRTNIFNPGEIGTAKRQPIVINPRGFRAYVRNDVFFQAIPQVLKHVPKARFVCPTMQGEAQAERWVNQFKISEAVELLPRQSRQQMADLYRQAQVFVSLTTHDGTPNTLLEALACGCFPIAGDLESIREWIEPGINGFLVPSDDHQALAEAILEAIRLPNLCAQAARINKKLILERAEYKLNMQKALGFYKSL